MKKKHMSINDQIRETMKQLGCKELRTGIFRHPRLKFDLDLSAADPDEILIVLCNIFMSKGFKDCQCEIRDALGL
jgi:hypothetical protein